MQKKKVGLQCFLENESEATNKELGRKNNFSELADNFSEINKMTLLVKMC